MSISASDAALALLALAACASPVAVPDPPDMAPLVTRYEAPTGSFAPSDTAQVIDEGGAQLAVLAGGDVTVFLTHVMGAFSKRLDDTGLGPNGEDAKTRVDAVLSLELDCARPAGARGSIAMKTVLEDNHLSRVLWGTARACAVTTDERVAVDGSIAIYRYAAANAGPEQAAFLVRVDGSVTAGARSRTAFDFRVDKGAVETRVALPTGDVLVSRHGTGLVVRATNGTFTCKVVSRTCSA